MRASGRFSSFSHAAVVCVVVMGGGGLVFADGPPGSGGLDCCFTKCCSDGSGGFDCAISCKGGACSTPLVCSGEGGCNPVWAQWTCIPHP
jgi:hypothetical protein